MGRCYCLRGGGLLRSNWSNIWAITVISTCFFLFTFSLYTPVLAGGSGAKGSSVAKSVRLGGDKLRTRFIADLSKKVPYQVFMLADPYRVIINLPDVRFQMPAGLGDNGRGLVSAYRYGLFAPGKSRIVIDVSGPFLIDKSFVLDTRKGQPARLVIDLVPTDKRSFLAALGKSRKDFLKDEAKRRAQEKKKNKVNIDEIARSKKNGKPLIIIDPGHGGIDGGAVSRRGTKEKDVVLSFSKRLRDRLRASGKFRVHLTRSIDVFIPLAERVKIARRKKASLLISIHADSLPRRKAKGVRGATVYTLSEEASDNEAKLLAAKENRSDILAGVPSLKEQSSPITSILIDLVQRETKNHSKGFAGTVLENMKRFVKTKGSGRLNKKPHRYANLRVLRAPDVPSILLELGYLSSKDDEKLLKSTKWQGKVADVLVKSVQKYFSKRLARVPY